MIIQKIAFVDKKKIEIQFCNFQFSIKTEKKNGSYQRNQICMWN
jgi:hypothetical protein